MDKAVSGIGRELRYFEYKFRKNQQKNKKKKDKNGNLSNQDLAWTDSSQTSDIQSTGEEYRKAMPGSSGEEELQIQVALAMSREEEQERDRRSESDKMRLEMAIKESMKQAEYSKHTQETKNQPSLLDLSLNAPKPAGAASSQFQNQPMIATSNDPWASSTPSSTTFDPFASQVSSVTANTQPTIPTQSSNPWGVPAQTQVVVPAPQPVIAPAQDPWGSMPAPAAVPDPWVTTAQPSAQRSNPQNNAWGSAAAPQQSTSQIGTWGIPETAPAVTANQQSNAWGAPNPTPASTQNGTWGNPDPFLSLSQPQEAPKSTYDPFSGATSIPQTQSSVMFSAPSSQANAPFGMGTQGGDVFTAPPFDPLKDFDNLHLGSNEPEAVVLSNDFTPGMSVSKDLFPVPAAQPMNPNPMPQNINGAPMMQATTNSNPQNRFLGENSSLVNLDSGWRYQVPYSTKPLGSTSMNPFQQTGPTKTLNEMMERQGGFQ